MRRNFFLLLSHFVLSLTLAGYSLKAQTSGSITGKVTDAQTGEILPGATIYIMGTQNGTTSDIYGEYFLIIPGGKKTVEVRFIGYGTVTREINVELGTIQEINFELESEAFIGEEVVITAQALGQQAAINQQIQAKSIVTIVSKDRIESLPDQNAAESVGRLAGVSIRREGGEGQEVIVRGLSPRFNAITINGERIPSSDANSRSFDLSTISTDALQGIEVFKSWTPDLEGDAIGGTINFVTKKADEGLHGKVRYLHGYNGQQDEFGQHRVNADISRRFFNNKVGVLLAGNFQRADRSQDRIDRDDRLVSDDVVAVENINLEDRIETRDRFGGNIALDYTFKRGDIRLFSNYSQTNRDQVRRRRRYRFFTRRQEYELSETLTENALIANTLSSTYNFANKIVLETSASYSKTIIRTPFDHDVRFRENSAFDAVSTDTPTDEQIVAAAQNDLGLTFFQRARSDEDEIDFERITGQVDVSYPFDIGSAINAKVKIGGKLRLDSRTRDIRRFQARFDALENIAEANPDEFVTNGNQILIENFIGDFVAEDFSEGEFFLGPGTGRVNGGHLSDALLRQFFNDNFSFYERDVFVDGNDYEADENIYSGYIRADFEVGKLNVSAGVRHETTDLDYLGFGITGTAASSEINTDEDPRAFLSDSSVSRSYGEWLPALNVKYQVKPWMDLRGAVTRTLSRPNFLNLVPFLSIDLDQQQIQRGNFNLQHQTSLNYDFFASFYNKFGLLTIGAFYKEIDNIDFTRESFVTPITPGINPNFNGFVLIQPENALGVTEVRGIEIDIQVNFSSLPQPWNGIILAANATFIESETPFPDFVLGSRPIRPLTIERIGTLPGQPEETYNISIGYEKGGFSGRFSIIHQANAFGFGDEAGDRLGGLDAEVTTNDLTDAFTRRTTRLDLSLTQKFMKNYTVFFNANNITDQQEVEFNGGGIITSDQQFGFTLDLGLQYKF